MSMKEQIILGIDPGTSVMGFGIIKVENTKLSLIDLGILKMKTTDSHALRLKHIFENTLKLIDKHHPDSLAIEAPFFGKNVQSMLKLGRAQGVAMAAALFREIPITEYSPKKIKQSITGNGNASKEQVAAMLSQLLKFNLENIKLDATDGLGAAVCHHLQGGKPEQDDKKYSGWNAFLKENPDRLK